MIKVAVCRDGGTTIYEHLERQYYLDNRIASKTKGKWFWSYPDRDNSNIITDVLKIAQLNQHYNDLIQLTSKYK